jgi:hypothetical protein
MFYIKTSQKNRDPLEYRFEIVFVFDPTSSIVHTASSDIMTDLSPISSFDLSSEITMNIAEAEKKDKQKISSSGTKRSSPHEATENPETKLTKKKKTSKASDDTTTFKLPGNSK